MYPSGPEPHDGSMRTMNDAQGRAATDTPDGFWQRESNENPQPISPMAESFFLDALTAGTRHAFAELGILAEAAEWRAIGRWVYLRTIPFAGDDEAVAERLDRARAAVHDDL